MHTRQRLRRSLWEGHQAEVAKRGVDCLFLQLEGLSLIKAMEIKENDEKMKLVRSRSPASPHSNRSRRGALEPPLQALVGLLVPPDFHTSFLWLDEVLEGPQHVDEVAHRFFNRAEVAARPVLALAALFISSAGEDYQDR